MEKRLGELVNIEFAKIRTHILSSVVSNMTNNGTPSDVIRKCKALEEWVFEDFVDVDDFAFFVLSKFDALDKVTKAELIEEYKKSLK